MATVDIGGSTAMIEVGIHPDSPGAMMYHSTDSGRFMPAGRDETIEFLNAVKRGDFDGLFASPPVHTSASAAAPAPARGPARPFIDLSHSGLLWLINRVVFHPRGFALSLDIRGDVATGWLLQGDGTEPVSFTQGD